MAFWSNTKIQSCPVTKRPSGLWSSAGRSMAHTCWHNAPIVTAAKEYIFPTPVVTETAPIARTTCDLQVMKTSSGSKINWTSDSRPNTTWPPSPSPGNFGPWHGCTRKSSIP